MAAAKPPRATVVVPLVARPLVTWMTATPASRAFECGHGAGRAAADDQHVGLVMFDGNFEARRVCDCIVIFAASGLGDFNECVHAGIGKDDVVDVQRMFFDARALQVRFQGIHEQFDIPRDASTGPCRCRQDRARGAWYAR